MSEVLRSVSHVLRSLLRKPASEGLLLDNYATTCLALDEMIYEVRTLACLPRLCTSPWKNSISRGICPAALMVESQVGCQLLAFWTVVPELSVSRASWSRQIELKR